MKRYWTVVTSLVVLVVAIAFLILSRGSSKPDDKAALAATPTPEATAAASPGPYVPPQVPGGPLMLPLPRGTMIDPQSIRNVDSAMDTNRLQWLGQAEELMALLLVIDGDRTYCGNLCPLTATPAEVIDRLNQQCARVVLSAVRYTYQNYPEVTGAIDLYNEGCTRLKAASDRLGKPVDTQAWRDARAEIVRAMRPGVTAGRAQATLAQIPPGPTPSPLRSAGAYYPEGTLTGIAAVDKFLRVMYTGDLATLADDAVSPTGPVIARNEVPAHYLALRVCPKAARSRWFHLEAVRPITPSTATGYASASASGPDSTYTPCTRAASTGSTAWR